MSRVPWRYLLGPMLLALIVVVARSSSTSPPRPVVTTMGTPLGAVSVTVHNPQGPRLAICVHGFNRALVDEWSGVASVLANSGYRVLMPNLHSNPSTKPGAISQAEFASVALALANGQPAVWLGKSWGGANVASFAAAQPKAVTRVVLDAPALDARSVPELCVGMHGTPLLLLWAEDDTVVPLASAVPTWRARCPHATLHTEPTGGHRILTDAYVPAVLAFLG